MSLICFVGAPPASVAHLRRARLDAKPWRRAARTPGWRRPRCSIRLGRYGVRRGTRKATPQTRSTRT
eukprot:4249429-Pleurochrysis_carterae.AAC.1